MKRLLLLIAFVSGVFLIGCNVENSFKDEPNYTNVTGILKEQSSTDTREGTHILTDKNGNETLLRAISFNLSDENYLNNEVEVTGVMNTNENIFEVTGINVIKVLSPIQEKKPEIVEYKNSDLGFEFNYYNTWDKTEEPDGKILFSLPATSEKNNTFFDKIEISQTLFNYTPITSENGETDTPLSSFMKRNFPEVTDINPYLNHIGPANLEAIKMEKTAKIDYYLYRNGLIYKISFIPADIIIDKGTGIDNISLFNELISSFNFIGFTIPEELSKETTEEASTNLLTEIPVIDLEFTYFESLPYYFSAKYPANWYYSGKSGNNGVFHHYGFSDESVTDDNELISLDVISNDIPINATVIYENNIYKTIDPDETVNIYISKDNQKYKIYGNKDYETIMLIMADSIKAVEKKDQP